MKHLSFILFAMVFLFTACEKQEDPTETARAEYDNFCSNNSDGAVAYSIDGNKWETNCNLAVATLIDSANGTSSILIYSYIFDGDFFDEDIEVVTITLTSVNDMVTTYSGSDVFAFFFESLDLTQETTPQAEEYYSSIGSSDSTVEITSFDGNRIQGEVNMSLSRAADGDMIQLTGSFDVAIRN